MQEDIRKFLNKLKIYYPILLKVGESFKYEYVPPPHSDMKFPPDKNAVYCFAIADSYMIGLAGEILKIGRAGPKSV